MQTKHGSVLLLLLLPGSLALVCYEGKEEANSTLDQYNPAACTDHQDWCFSMFSLDKNGFNTKMCWNKDWEHGRYKEDGCIVGQHCISGVCYENATVCLCNDQDLCNGFVENGNISTPIPYPPTTPPDQHECYYGFKENNKTSGLEFTEQCFNTEQLCVRVTKDEEGYEYRSCWDSIFNIEFSRPGCYKGFQHCHSDTCHNDTLLCVCADNLCNTEKFTSEAPPITPGSGLYCYARDWEDDSMEEKACSADENYCIEFTSLESDHVLRDCWNPTEYNKYNFTGCETTQSCFRGSCYNATVCICQDDLCNGFGIAGNNMTTPEPVTMTTTNKTMHCWYGFHHNGSTEHAWQREECAPQEDRCILITSTDGFTMGHCYDVNYDDGKYVSGTYETGEHCWDGTCHNGTIYVCLETMCNGEGATTPTPHHTTPGSGLDCYYGSIVGDDKKNLTTQICTKNETMCIAVYGKDNYFSGSCWDPTQEDGRYNMTDKCSYGLHCWHHEDGTQECASGTVCTCDTSLCNSVNVSSTLPTESTPTTASTTFRCWFGEKHPHTGEEDWKIEECEEKETYCYQMVHGEGETRTESRQCWNLAYEDGKYSGAGCYKGELCHHEHCYNDTTVCLCTESECNDWSATGNVTTDVPVTGGSGLLCYSGTFDNYEAKPCAESESLCMGFSGGQGTFDCYDPQTNDALFVTNGCWDGVDIEQTQDSTVGRLCLCSDEPLCNERFKDQPGGAGYILLNPLFVPTLIIVWILSGMQ